MSQNERSQRLRAGLQNYDRVSQEVHSAFDQTEDALTALEDREARRSQRNASGGGLDDKFPAMKGRS